MYFVYIIRSETSGRYYIGYTDNVERRVQEHNAGKTISTRKRGPWKVIFTEQHTDRQAAWRREQHIKSFKGGEAFQKLIRGEVA